MIERYVVFGGRPNAGKSSIVKNLFGYNIATGRHPGTTKHFSKYILSRGLFLVDMPGFGKITKASKSVEERAKRNIIDFFKQNARSIDLAIHVLDITNFLEVTRRLEKKGHISLDVEMIQFMAKNLSEPPLVAANKIDKASKSKISLNLKELIQSVSEVYNSTTEHYIFPVSAKTGEGLGNLKKTIHNTLVRKGHKAPFIRCPAK